MQFMIKRKRLILYPLVVATHVLIFFLSSTFCFAFDGKNRWEAEGTAAVAAGASGIPAFSDPAAAAMADAKGGESRPSPSPVETFRVPKDYATIQEAVDAAGDGDLVLVSPGFYSGGVTISGKSITLASRYHVTGDPSFIDRTNIKGGSPGIHVKSTAAGTVIKGFRFTEGKKSIQLFSNGSVIGNHFDDTGSDAISFENVGGAAVGNVCFSPSDDCIDVDYPMSDLLIEKNVIKASGDDGVEIRNDAYSGASVTITIRDNIITASGEDGVQIIDSPKKSNRKFIIEGNLITKSVGAGLGLMDDGETMEDFRAASVPERIHVFNNTFDGNSYGITGGDNLIAVNNIISNSTTLGIKNTDNASIVAYTLFWNNARNHIGSNVELATTWVGDPLHTTSFKLKAGSPAIDIGTARFVRNGEVVLSIPAPDYSGKAPDLGGYEKIE